MPMLYRPGPERHGFFAEEGSEQERDLQRGGYTLREEDLEPLEQTEDASEDGGADNAPVTETEAETDGQTPETTETDQVDDQTPEVAETAETGAEGQTDGASGDGGADNAPAKTNRRSQ